MKSTSAAHRIEVSWAACPRWATSESADLVDAVEQLGGNWAVLLIDVQGSGGGGRRLAANLMRMTREALGAGLDARTAVMTANQHLFALRNGKVGASVHVCSIDPGADCVSIAGLGKLTVGALCVGTWETGQLQGQLAGFDRDAQVESITCDFHLGEQIVIANDGIAHDPTDLSQILQADQAHVSSPLDARLLLDLAIERDSGRPRADMAIVTIAHCQDESEDRTLRARVSVPFRRVRSDL